MGEQPWFFMGYCRLALRRAVHTVSLGILCHWQIFALSTQKRQYFNPPDCRSYLPPSFGLSSETKNPVLFFLKASFKLETSTCFFFKAKTPGAFFRCFCFNPTQSRHDWSQVSFPAYNCQKWTSLSPGTGRESRSDSGNAKRDIWSHQNHMKYKNLPRSHGIICYIGDILFLLCLKDAPWFFAKFILWRFGDFFPLGVLARRAASIAEVWDRN